MPTAQFACPPRGNRPLDAGAPSVGRELTRVAHEGQKQLSVVIGQWEMLITFFKHALEVPLCMEPNNDKLRESHRAFLTSVMSLGECVLTQINSTTPDELLAAGYSVEFVRANVRYLRDTYQQWYAERDAEAVNKAHATICDELTKVAA